MSMQLTQLRVYVGLFLSQFFAITCNAFLDIEYGIFVYELAFWATIFGFSIYKGWSQNGELNEYGRKWTKRLLILGAILSVVVFLPVWGLPRAGIYALGMLLAAYNCSTTSKRQLYWGLMMTLVMVMFAASHFRADWTMLFYLLPYTVSVIFTIIAEQLSHTHDTVKNQTFVAHTAGSQATAITMATCMILVIGSFLYLITPQKTIMSMHWQWGNPTALSKQSNHLEHGNHSGSANGNASNISIFSNWLSPHEIRSAALREGMPQWQAAAINLIADGVDLANTTLKPIKKKLDDLWDAFVKWFNSHLQEILLFLVSLSILVILIALFTLAKESMVILWVRTKVDYVLIAFLLPHTNKTQPLMAYYGAIGRLFELQETKRSKFMNAREYVEEIRIFFKDQANDMEKFTRIFEDQRYGKNSETQTSTQLLANLYKSIYKSLN